MSADWIAVDWGTTHLRVWPMTGARAGEMRQSDQGMGGLRPDGFEPALLALIGDWLGPGRMPVLACGMVGSRQGWREARYVPVPAAPATEGLARAQTSDPRLDVRIIPGLSQAKPADVMRGEETQIAGFLSLNPKFDGVLCLPGTHTKWVHISAEEVVSFQTFMSGEMFQAFAQHTVLRHSIAAEGWDAGAFAQAVSDTLSAPETLARRLFALRAETLLNGQDPVTQRARLSGLLIGAELAAARPYWLGREIAVIGAPELSNIYISALATQAVPATMVSGAKMTLKGLVAAYGRNKEHIT